VGVVMKILVAQIPTGKVRRLSFYAAAMAFFMMVVEPTYASANMQFYVTIPSEPLPPNLPLILICQLIPPHPF